MDSRFKAFFKSLPTEDKTTLLKHGLQSQVKIILKQHGENKAKEFLMVVRCRKSLF